MNNAIKKLTTAVIVPTMMFVAGQNAFGQTQGGAPGQTGGTQIGAPGNSGGTQVAPPVITPPQTPGTPIVPPPIVPPAPPIITTPPNNVRPMPAVQTLPTNIMPAQNSALRTPPAERQERTGNAAQTEQPRRQEERSATNDVPARNQNPVTPVTPVQNQVNVVHSGQIEVAHRIMNDTTRVYGDWSKRDLIIAGGIGAASVLTLFGIGKGIHAIATREKDPKPKPKKGKQKAIAKNAYRRETKKSYGNLYNLVK